MYAGDFDDWPEDEEELRGVNEFDDPSNPQILHQDDGGDDEKWTTVAHNSGNDDRLLHAGFAMIDQYVSTEPDFNSKCWRARPEFPTSNELMDRPESWETDTAKVALLANKPEGAFESREIYLKTHYDLLREEAVKPLRDAVSHARKLYRSNRLYEVPGKKHSIGIYSHVFIRGFTFSDRGVGVEVSFSIKSCKKAINWETVKRLTSGTLVALSSDGFESQCIVASVVARNINKLKASPPRIDLLFDQAKDIDIDPTKQYIMIEDRRGFFPQQRQAMRAYQRLYDEDFPFSEAIVSCDKDSLAERPYHIASHPRSDISDIFPGHDDYDITTSLPEDGMISLDLSQIKALEHILQSQLAIVQGPPGTGKTYVSVQALRILLKRMQPGDAPIVIACQTNHALDQLLLHVAAFEPDFARVGGRSKEKGYIEARGLRALRQNMPWKKRDPQGDRRQARGIKNALVQQFSQLLVPFSMGQVELQHLQKAKLLSQEQCESIRNGDDEWEQCDPEQEDLDALYEWLGKYMVAVASPDAKEEPNFLVEDEEDMFNMELIKDQQAEITNPDADLDQLHGSYIPIAQNWAGRARAPLTEAEVTRLLQKQNMWDIPPSKRGAVFNHLLRGLKSFVRTTFTQLVIRYNENVVAGSHKASLKQDLTILSQQKLIAMTTTGLNIRRPLLHALQCKVIMIEEAAETLESLVVGGGCVPSLQHLILVGDHKQLRPSTVNSDHQEQFHFALSLFERMVNNNFTFVMLNTQRRMIPDIRHNLLPIYGTEIRDHESVHRRPRISGMHSRTWMYSHDHPDKKDEVMSSFNPYESEMIVGFYMYLLQNGYKSEQITVLTFYNAQRKYLVRELRKALGQLSFDHIKVVTVDSYQGEENDIVILSLVRSTMSETIGFAGLPNRICVALSRARNGLYIFGNMKVFANKSEIWNKVYEIMDDEEKVSMDNFPIWCEKHQNMTMIESPPDWETINGGCRQKCKITLTCGHPCPSNCHPQSHDSIQCEERCPILLACQHFCSNRCGEECSCELCPRSESLVSRGRKRYVDVATAERKVKNDLNLPFRDSPNRSAATTARSGQTARTIAIATPTPSRGGTRHHMLISELLALREFDPTTNTSRPISRLSQSVDTPKGNDSPPLASQKASDVLIPLGDDDENTRHFT